MEFLEMISEGNWSSFDSTISMEESDMMAQLFGGPCSSFTNVDHDSTHPDAGESSSSRFLLDLSDNIANPNFPCYYSLPPHEIFHNCYSNSSDQQTSIPEIDLGIDFAMSEDPSYLLGDHQICSAEEIISSTYPENSTMSIKRKFDGNENGTTIVDLEKDSNDNTTAASPMKKARSTSNIQAKKITRTRRSKKSQKNENKKDSEKEEKNGAPNGQSSSCYSSEDDSNESNGKNRAGRGSATDPQSLYARKRRERINERLRILQNLVPNGTKVDISTMLEEAVNYVKFLQLQIKLLSSDDLWMYAPLAYNGMDIGLNFHQYLSPPKK